MDAKPQRPVRAVRARDENVPITSNGTKTLHQRNKSTPALSTLAGPGGVKNAVKRTAFGDVSNTVNAVRVAKDDSSISSKPATTGPEKPVALSRPAQRANSVLGTKTLSKGSTNTSITTGAGKPTTTLDRTQSNPRKITTKRSNVVFKDPALPPVAETAPQSATNTTSTQITQDTAAAKQEVTDVSVTKNRPLPDPPKLPQSKEAGNGGGIRHSASIDGAYSERNGNVYPHDSLSGIANSQDIYHPVAKMEANGATQIYLQSNGVSHADPAASAGLKHEPLAPSEPDEYFDDEEDDNYEDDGYVTARSHRSRSDNTTGAATTILFPKVTQQAKRELAVAKQVVESTRTVEDVEEECWDTSMVAEYGEEIFDYMRDLEMRLLPNPHYMDNQAEIQWSMRAVLMDWLVQVHHRFALLPETLFLCVNYIDRFLSCKIVSLGKLQLVGATAIFIAAKYEEINCPSLSEIVYMVDNGYSADEILKAERFMLSMLQFELGWPGPMSFLRRISKADDYDLETRTLAKYFLEVTIMDERFVGTPPSFTAAGAHCLARLMLRKGTWSHAHVYYSGYTYSQLYPLVSMILECCDNPRKHHLAVYEKYTDRKFKRASYFVEGEVMKEFKLPEPHRENSASHLIDLFDNVSSWRRP